jgi:hypothetical protein
MIAAISEDAHRVDLEEARWRRPVLPDIQLHLDFPVEEVIYISHPPSTHSPNASTFKRDSKSSHPRHISYQLPPQLVKDFLDLPDHVTEPEPRHKSLRNSLRVPRPSSLQTLSTSFWVGPTGRNRREHQFIRCLYRVRY